MSANPGEGLNSGGAADEEYVLIEPPPRTSSLPRVTAFREYPTILESISPHNSSSAEIENDWVERTSGASDAVPVPNSNAAESIANNSPSEQPIRDSRRGGTEGNQEAGTEDYDPVKSRWSDWSDWEPFQGGHRSGDVRSRGSGEHGGSRPAHRQNPAVRQSEERLKELSDSSPQLSPAVQAALDILEGRERTGAGTKVHGPEESHWNNSPQPPSADKLGGGIGRSSSQVHAVPLIGRKEAPIVDPTAQVRSPSRNLLKNHPRTVGGAGAVRSWLANYPKKAMIVGAVAGATIGLLVGGPPGAFVGAAVGAGAAGLASKTAKQYLKSAHGAHDIQANSRSVAYREAEGLNLGSNPEVQRRDSNRILGAGQQLTLQSQNRVRQGPDSVPVNSDVASAASLLPENTAPERTNHMPSNEISGALRIPGYSISRRSPKRSA
ncbi:hypothetical protein E4K73_49880 [Streptomyces sp. IB201691-2A2]|nr:hypothetical protein E4K73_49880 [Streptomyces sp. IB201691-2A2]